MSRGSCTVQKYIPLFLGCFLLYSLFLFWSSASVFPPISNEQPAIRWESFPIIETQDGDQDVGTDILIPKWKQIHWESYPILEIQIHSKPKRIELNPCEHLDPNYCERIERMTRLVYPNFIVPRPNFASNTHRELWNNMVRILYPSGYFQTENCNDEIDVCKSRPHPHEALTFYMPRQTQGHLMTFRNGTVSTTHTYGCGMVQDFWKNIMDHPPENSVHVSEVLNIRVPDSWSFQHMLDGALPKLAQWLNDISPETRIYLDNSDINSAIMKRIKGVEFSQWITNPIVSAERFHFGCSVPEVHPHLWQKIQWMFGVRDIPLEHRKTVIYNTRNSARERRVFNEVEVLEAISKHLKERNLGEELVVYDSSQYSLEQSIELFNAARAIIGPHGGAMYNGFFSPPGTLVVEFHPMIGRRPEHYGGIPYFSGAFLGHNYWMFLSPARARHFVEVELDYLPISLT